MKTRKPLEHKRLIKIGKIKIGDGYPTFIVAEIGINHNGDLKVAKKLIDIAKGAGCDAVKFQKRTVELLYTPEELARPKESPFGTTEGDYRRGREFGKKQYQQIDKYCKKRKIMWFASPWDTESVDFLEKFKVPCYKVASACLTDDKLLRRIKKTGKPVIMSTGMSTPRQIKQAVKILGQKKLALLQCTATYPSQISDLNLKTLLWFRKQFFCPVGYSGHETGIVESVVAVVLGASIVERHITLDRAMWGTDQAASLEPQGLQKMVRDIRNLPLMLGSGKKNLLESEIPILQKLRRGR
jgi:N-acetylneuraminate synthase